MILHIATFTWRSDVTDEQVAGVTTALRDMAGSLPTVQYYECGPNRRVRPSPADFVVVAVVNDDVALLAYLDSPEHAAVQREWLDHMVETRVAAQLELVGTGALGSVLGNAL